MSSSPPLLAEQVWDRLLAADRDFLRALAARLEPGAQLALVGGAVRDALLGQTPLDLDVVADQDIRALAQASGLPFIYHPAFDNATLTLPDGRAVDLVRARQERYPVPGQHPQVQPGSLTDDLWRRDFSLNALALRLDGVPALIDPTGGLTDLQERRLRPLHAQSFQQDASRLIRGVRLAARLKLTPTAEFLEQVPLALSLAQETPRLWAELRLLLGEPAPGQASQLLHQWGELAGWPRPEALSALEALKERGETVEFTTSAAALLNDAARDGLDVNTLTERLHLGERPGALLTRVHSERPYPPGTPERQLRSVLGLHRYEPLGGKDLLALGLSPGPQLGLALAHLANLRRQGIIRTLEEEKAALDAYLARED